MEELKAPTCPQCKRPLQRARPQCLYCGYQLNEEEQQLVTEALDDASVDKQIRRAQALLDASLPKQPAPQRKLWFKILVVLLSLGMTLAFAWISNWNLIVIVLAGLFFTLPVWRVFRR